MSGIWKRNHLVTAPDLDSTPSRGTGVSPVFDGPFTGETPV